MYWKRDIKESCLFSFRRDPGTSWGHAAVGVFQFVCCNEPRRALCSSLNIIGKNVIVIFLCRRKIILKLLFKYNFAHSIIKLARIYDTDKIIA